MMRIVKASQSSTIEVAFLAWRTGSDPPLIVSASTSPETISTQMIK
jgi:hypothetical protein